MSPDFYVSPQRELFSVSVRATGDYPKCRFIDFNGGVAGAGAGGWGVCDTDTDAGDMMHVVTHGVWSVECGLALPGGSVEVESDAVGRCVPHGSGVVRGRTLPNQAPTVPGQFVPVFLLPQA